jgi:hypothetical protein
MRWRIARSRSPRLASFSSDCWGAAPKARRRREAVPGWAYARRRRLQASSVGAALLVPEVRADAEAKRQNPLVAGLLTDDGLAMA